MLEIAGGRKELGVGVLEELAAWLVPLGDVEHGWCGGGMMSCRGIV